MLMNLGMSFYAFYSETSSHIQFYAHLSVCIKPLSTYDLAYLSVIQIFKRETKWSGLIIIE